MPSSNPSSHVILFCDKPLSIISSAIRYIKKHPALLAFSFVSALPGSLYSLTLLSGKQPENIDAKWWGDMTPEIRCLSVVNMTISIYIFMLTNLKYMPLAFTKLKYNLKHFRDSFKTIILNCSSIFLGLAVGIIYGDQAFNAFLWTTLVLSIASGLTNFLSYSSRRYNGIMDLIKLVQNVCSDDYLFQNQCISELELLNADYQELLNQEYKGRELIEETVIQFMISAYTKALFASPISIFNNVTPYDKASVVARKVSKVAIGSFCAIAVIFTSIENSYDGIHLLSDKATDAIPRSSKIILGLIPALANAVFYFISGMDFQISLEHIKEYAKQGIFNFLKALVMVIFNVLAATGYYVVAKAATDSEKNILQLQGSEFNDIIPIFYALAVFITGINNTDIIYHQKHKVVSDHKDIINWVKSNSLSKSNVTLLRQHGFFSCSNAQGVDTKIEKSQIVAPSMNLV